MLKIAEFATLNDRLVAMNLSAPFLCTFFQEPMLKMLPHADILFGNEAVVYSLSPLLSFMPYVAQKLRGGTMHSLVENISYDMFVILHRGGLRPNNLFHLKIGKNIVIASSGKTDFQFLKILIFS